MGGNKDMWLALGDPMLAQLTGNDWAEDHKREINTSAAAAAAIMAAIFAPYAFAGAGAAGAGAGAAGAGEAAAGSALAAEAGGGAVGAGSLVGAEMGTAGAGLGSAGYGAAGAGMTAADAAYLDAMGGYTLGAGANDAAGMGVGGLLSADTAFPAYVSAMELEAGGGGTGGLMGAGTSAPADSMSAANGMSAWDRIGKGLDTYNKYSKIAGSTQGLLAPPQQPQTPQPRPMTMGQAKQQQGPADWATVFGPGLSDEEIRKHQLLMMQYGYGAH